VVWGGWGVSGGGGGSKPGGCGVAGGVQLFSSSYDQGGTKEKSAQEKEQAKRETGNLLRLAGRREQGGREVSYRQRVVKGCSGIIRMRHDRRNLKVFENHDGEVECSGLGW